MYGPASLQKPCLHSSWIKIKYTGCLNKHHSSPGGCRGAGRHICYRNPPTPAGCWGSALEKGALENGKSRDPLAGTTDPVAFVNASQH